MCGIVGIANRGGSNCIPELEKGLERLEYRGYDSAGVAFFSEGQIQTIKTAGAVANLEKAIAAEGPSSSVGIAHTRWATHGEPTKLNAHPHFTDELALVHNGIIENYQELKKPLAQKYKFVSQTDTEVVAWLITDFLKNGLSPTEAFSKTLPLLKGSFALAVIMKSEPLVIYCAKQGSPLVVGSSQQGNYVCSDSSALGRKGSSASFLEDGDWAILSKDKLNIYDKSGNLASRPAQSVSAAAENELGSYSHYIEKEIHEQPDALKRTFQAVQNAHLLECLDLLSLQRITFVGCGTAYFAAVTACATLEKWVTVPLECRTASELRYSSVKMDSRSLIIAISQSGETADTLEAIKKCKAAGAKVLALVNVAQSSIARTADKALCIEAGPEIGVASTKAFTSQMMALLLLGAEIAQKLSPKFSAQPIFDELRTAPELVKEALKQENVIKQIAKKFSSATSALYLGRQACYGLAEEGSLKLKELSYIHSEAYPAGEMKHGPIALIDELMPTIALMPHNELFEKMLSNVKEIEARKGQLILITDERGEKELSHFQNVITLPSSSELQSLFIFSIALQLLAYHVALFKGHNVDKPRNLAKSVTVE